MTDRRLTKAYLFYRDVILNWHKDECLTWPFSTSRGYARIAMDGRTVSVHRTLCAMENGPPPSSEHHAAHTCGNGKRGCVNRHHLKWATPKENEADKEEHGTVSRGERQGFSKLTEADVIEILRVGKGMTLKEQAKKYGMHKDSIWAVRARRQWKHVSPTSPSPIDKGEVK